MNIKTLINTPEKLRNSKKITVIMWIVALTFSFTCHAYAVDFSAPLIELPKLEPPETDDSPIYIEVIVEDDKGVDAVQLYYRPVNSSAKYSLTKMKLIKVGKNKYFVELPTSVFKMKGLDYYVEARDKANNVSQEPFPKQPRKIFFDGISGNRKSGSNISINSNWGASVSYGSYSVDDPDGPTGSTATPSFSLYHRSVLSRNTTAWLSLSYQNFLLPYSQTQIGQEVQSIYLDALYRRGFSLAGNRAWVGGGLGVGANKIKDRWTTSQGNFRDKDFGNRSQTDYGIILDAGYEVKVAKGNWIGIRAMLYESNNSGVNRRAIGIYFDIN